MTTWIKFSPTLCLSRTMALFTFNSIMIMMRILMMTPRENSITNKKINIKKKEDWIRNKFRCFLNIDIRRDWGLTINALFVWVLWSKMSVQEGFLVNISSILNALMNGWKGNLSALCVVKTLGWLWDDNFSFFIPSLKYKKK